MKLCFAMLLGCILAAQAVAVDLPFKKKPQEFTTHKPEDVVATLRNGTPTQRNDLALELGILAPVPGDSAVKPNAPCVNFSHIEQRAVMLRAGAENEVLLVDSAECESTYIVVFDKAPKSEWRHVQTVRMTARAERPDITFAELIQPGVSEILVRHETTHDGGSLGQQDFGVLKLVHDHVEVVLDATEHSEITLANRDPEDTDVHQQTQVSTFDLLKAPPKSAAQYRILEKQVISDDKTTITRFVVWTWNPELERFRPAPFDGGNARPAATKPAATPGKKPTAPAKPK
ncbi:MAG TPA: hypothetical protein VMT56_02180 [Candidatus Bathyarchaeia archaeon]|nr:hypothetical protein [Candidatus Bathyarchaeia archaeon]